MHTNELEQSRRDSVQNNKDAERRRKIGFSSLVGGGIIVGASLFGLMANEAESPQDALGSVNIGDKTYFFEKEEIPVVVLGGVGLLAVGIGYELLRRDEEE